VVRSVRVCDISELSLVPSISMQSSNHDFFCVGVMYSVNTSPMLCQQSYKVKSVQVCGISELSLVPSIPIRSYDHDIFSACPVWIYTQSITSKTLYSPE
jgi:hypothetical protein